MTNTEIEIFEEKEDWEGNLTFKSLGNYFVYLEGHSTREPYNFSNANDARGADIQSRTKGFFILFSDIDLTEKQIKYNNEKHIIANWDRYVFPEEGFHHIEATFK